MNFLLLSYTSSLAGLWWCVRCLLHSPTLTLSSSVGVSGTHRSWTLMRTWYRDRWGYRSHQAHHCWWLSSPSSTGCLCWTRSLDHQPCWRRDQLPVDSRVRPSTFPRWTNIYRSLGSVLRSLEVHAFVVFVILSKLALIFFTPFAAHI